MAGVKSHGAKAVTFTRTALVLGTVIALVAAVWGYAYEFAYFSYLNIDVHKVLTPSHFIYTGLVNVGPMVGFLVVLSLFVKFFSKNIEQDDLKVIGERLAAAKFSEELILARVGFIFSLGFMLLVIFDVRLGRDNGMGFMFWFMTFINVQFFFGSLCLSPPQAKVAVVFAFVVSVAMCFVAGGVEHARLSLKSETVLRDDRVVLVRREAQKIVTEPKDINLPIPFLQKAVSWIAKL